MLLLPHSKEKLQRLCQAHFGLIPYSGASEPEVIHNLFLLGKLLLKSFHLSLFCEELWICSTFLRKACSEAFSENLIPSTPSLTCFPKGTRHIQLQELSTHSPFIFLLTFNKGEALSWFQLQLTQGWRSQRLGSWEFCGTGSRRKPLGDHHQRLQPDLPRCGRAGC